jgi:DNA-binding protein Fis
LPEFLPATLQHGAEDASGSLAGLARFLDARLQAGATDLYAEAQQVMDRLLLRALCHTENNLSQAARILGVCRATLRTKLNALALSIARSSFVGG